MEIFEEEDEEIKQLMLRISKKEITLCETCDTFFDYIPQKMHCDDCTKKKKSKRKQTPEYREYQREYRQRPEVKERRRKYQQRPEYKALVREYYQRPEVKERTRKRKQTPEYKAQQREYQRKRYYRLKQLREEE